MTRSWLVAAAVVLLSLGSTAGAQTSSLVHVFVTVDAVTVTNSGLFITGIKEGEASPSQQSAPFGTPALDSCNRMALLAMTMPGQFLFTLDLSSSSYKCKLTRVNP